MDEPESKSTVPDWQANPAIPFVGGVIVGIAIRLIFSWDFESAYNAMTGAFVYLVPVAVGVVTVALSFRSKPRSLKYCVGAAAFANVFFVLGTLTILIEGLICVIIVAPLFAFIGGFAGLLTGLAFRWKGRRPSGMYSVVLLPFLVAPIEQPIPLTSAFNAVERSTVIPATPAEIWPHLLNTPEIQPHEIGGAWMYQIGVPLPLSSATTLHDGALTRNIAMGRGIQFSLISKDWEPGQFIRWKYVFDENSVPERALDDHVKIGGPHFDLIETTYTLESVPAGTRLRVEITYRVTTRFNWYASWVANTLVGNFEEHALAFYAQRTMESAAP